MRKITTWAAVATTVTVAAVLCWTVGLLKTSVVFGGLFPRAEEGARHVVNETPWTACGKRWRH
ncbi:hypothetical protein OIU91_41625 (plasmid) [Streptomyces sp. NBC_01456]|uniref:hypothetical protein n=1 Tax=unclassified Streptomyces TaxID=2593676 RepID=UPI002E3140F2|nr:MULTISPECIES: hypothetical protein [unclassified Streptomyces]